ncbi:BRO-N domain-containing protein [Methylobacterium indicum]|uniref:BRO-N domain-containing protein n=1 Tax=Methylobacterium indicum TaxID=1775910 RepID=UPI0024350A51|nr:BRO family protein [Methylobacterium indicum]
MGSLTTFDFETRPLRLVDRNGESWFVATDAAGILGYAAAKDLTRTLDDDEKGGHRVPTPGGTQEVAIISEAGLYRAILQRRATNSVPAEIRQAITRFQRWVFHEVLPSLRRTGTYAPAEPSDAPGVATAFRSYFSIGELIGLDRNQAALAANRATRTTTGIDPLALMGATHLLAPQQAPLLTPTDLGKELGGLSAIATNNMLAERGFQEGRRDAKDRPYWVPTAAGERFAVFLDTGKKHSDGTPVRQLKWSADIVAALREATTADAPVA